MCISAGAARAAAVVAAVLGAACVPLGGRYSGDTEYDRARSRSAGDDASGRRTGPVTPDPDPNSLRAIARHLAAPYWPLKTDTLRRVIERACARGDAGAGTGAGADERSVALLVDTTGSMGGAIDRVAAAATVIERHAADGCRFAIIAYRDRGDEYVVRRFAPLGAAPPDIGAALRELHAGGGGDWPEAVWDALDDATLALAEGPAGARTLVLVGDAAAHPAPEVAERVVARVAEARIATVVLGATSDTFDTEEALAGGPGGRFAPPPTARPAPPPGAAPDPAALAAAAGRAAVAVVLAESALDAVVDVRVRLSAEAIAGAAAASLDVLLVLDSALGLDTAGTPRPGAKAAAPGAPVLVGHVPTGFSALLARLDELAARGARVGAIAVDAGASWPLLAPPAGAGAAAVATRGLLRTPLELLAQVVAKAAWADGRKPFVFLLSPVGSHPDDPTVEEALRRFVETRGASLTLVLVP